MCWLGFFVFSSHGRNKNVAAAAEGGAGFCYKMKSFILKALQREIGLWIG